MIEFLMVPGAPRPVAPFSHATAVDGWLFVTGQMPTDPEDDSAPYLRGSKRKPAGSSKICSAYSPAPVAPSTRSYSLVFT